MLKESNLGNLLKVLSESSSFGSLANETSDTLSEVVTHGVKFQF